jgi:hypothetical protein
VVTGARFGSQKRVRLLSAERREGVRILTSYLADQSKIVQTFSLQALADLAETDQDLREPVISILKASYQSGSPAVKSRVRKLLAHLE